AAVFFFFQAEDGIRDFHVTGVQTCALPICLSLHESRICLRLGLRTCPGTTIARDGLPSCVTPVNTLAAPAWGHALPTTMPPEGGGVMVRALSTTGLAGAVLRRYGNINPLSIDYACRPRLRSRLTQGRLA